MSQYFNFLSYVIKTSLEIIGVATKLYGFDDLQWSNEKTCRVIWDALQDYGRIVSKRTLEGLEMAPDMAYEDILNDFDSTWGVKGFIMTRSNLVVTCKVWPQMALFLDLHSDCASPPVFGCIFIILLQLNSQFVPKIRRNNKCTKWGTNSWSCQVPLKAKVLKNLHNFSMMN